MEDSGAVPAADPELVVDSPHRLTLHPSPASDELMRYASSTDPSSDWLCPGVRSRLWGIALATLPNAEGRKR